MQTAAGWSRKRCSTIVESPPREAAVEDKRILAPRFSRVRACTWAAVLVTNCARLRRPVERSIIRANRDNLTMDKCIASRRLPPSIRRGVTRRYRRDNAHAHAHARAAVARNPPRRLCGPRARCDYGYRCLKSRVLIIFIVGHAYVGERGRDFRRA